jgi:hypothetical protein
MELIMQSKTIFELILLLGRPAAGKSEILDYLNNIDSQTRMKNYHLGKLEVIDDFPMLWAWFEEDKILSEKFGKPRLHSDENEYFFHQYLWNLLIERITLDYHKKIRDGNSNHASRTMVLEFSRGSEHGGYQEAFEHLSDEILQRARILYVQVSFHESFRKNKKRFNPDRPDSILEHGLDDEKLETLYRNDDWQDLILESNSEQYLLIRGWKVPYVVFDNEDDVTTPGGSALGNRLEKTLDRLWRIEEKREQA